jgi:hypothetical protein
MATVTRDIIVAESAPKPVRIRKQKAVPANRYNADCRLLAKLLIWATRNCER